MTKQMSFTRMEQAVLPGFRDRMDKAESLEDVRKTFSETVSTLISDALGVPLAVRLEDVTLAQQVPNGFILSAELLATPGFGEAWKNSDLRRILSDMAKSAANRFNHLEKHPEKTEAKMYHHKQGKRREGPGMPKAGSR